MITEEQIHEIARIRGLAPLQVREEIARVHEEVLDRYEGAAEVTDITFDPADPTATLKITVKPLSEHTVEAMHLRTARLELAAVYGEPRTALPFLCARGLRWLR